MSEAAIAGAFGILLTAFAMNSAIGFVAQTRGAVVGGREAIRATLIDSEGELASVITRRATIKTSRAPSEVESEIASELAFPVMDGQKLRGTVDFVSTRCTRADARTMDACGRINQLRLELASAAEAVRIDRRIGELRSKIEMLRMKGGNVDANPQAGMISALTRGWMSATEVVMAQTLIFPILLELCAAFGLPLVVDGRNVRQMAGQVLAKHARPRAASEQPATVIADASSVAPVERRPPVETVEIEPPVRKLSGAPEHFLERGLPRDPKGLVPQSRLYAAYKQWCVTTGCDPLTAGEFVERFRPACDAAGVRWTEREGKHYIAGRKLAA